MSRRERATLTRSETRWAAARKVEEIRVRYDDTLDQLSREKRAAEKELRAALERAAELVGESLPHSQREQEEQRIQELLDGLEKKGDDK
jgi:hypothetical protein